MLGSERKREREPKKNIRSGSVLFLAFGAELARAHWLKPSSAKILDHVCTYHHANGTTQEYREEDNRNVPSVCQRIDEGDVDRSTEPIRQTSCDDAKTQPDSSEETKLDHLGRHGEDEDPDERDDRNAGTVHLEGGVGGSVAVLQR